MDKSPGKSFSKKIINWDSGPSLPKYFFSL